MSEQDLVDSESADKSGVFSFRTSEVTKKRIQEAIKGTGKKADEFMLQAISTMQEEENRVDLPSEWKALEQQVRSILPILNTTWHQTATILQQERVKVEKLKSRVQEINIKHAEKLIEIEKHEKELEKKLEVALKKQKDAEENAADEALGAAAAHEERLLRDSAVPPPGAVPSQGTVPRVLPPPPPVPEFMYNDPAIDFI